MKIIDGVIKWDWMAVDRIIMKTSKDVKIVNFTNFIQEFILRDATDYMISQKELDLPGPSKYIKDNKDIMLLHESNGLVYRCEIYDAKLHTFADLIFPALLKIKKIEVFDYVFGIYYVLVVDKSDETCLWASINSLIQMVRKKCWSYLKPHKFSRNYIFISRRTEGILYANLVKNGNVFTHMSTNYGQSWQNLHIQHTNSANDNTAIFDFSLYDPLGVPSNSILLDIQRGKSPDLQSYITFDGGFEWSSIPHSTFKAIALNYDSAILSVDQGSKTISYSVDKANSWLTYRLYKSLPEILYVGRLLTSDLKALIVSREEDIRLHFKILSFNEIFRTECKPEQYTTRGISKFQDSCYRGMVTSYKSRDYKIPCWGMSFTLIQKLTAKCACKLSNLECGFNYYSSDNLCVLDKQSDIFEEPINCDNILPNPTISSRYQVARGDHCDSNAIDEINRMLAVPEYCRLNDFANFIVLQGDTTMNVIHLGSNGAFLKNPPIYSIHINLNIMSGIPVAFDYIKRIIYSSFNGSIVSYGLDTDVAFTTLYQVNAQIQQIDFEPLCNMLIYLEVDKNLRALSLLTNFEIVISKDVISFSYSAHERTISYIKARNQLCYGNLFGHHQCVETLYDIIQEFVDIKNSRALFLTSSRTLIISALNPFEPSLQSLFEIDHVEDFSVYGDNLYFLRNRVLFHRHLHVNTPDMPLYVDQTFIKLFLHRESWASLYNGCQSKGCQFLCDPVSYDEVRCLCPYTNVTTNDKMCTCVPEKPNCLKQFCRGFLCHNIKCLHYSVICNGVNDCGDGSDEIDCIKLIDNENQFILKENLSHVFGHGIMFNNYDKFKDKRSNSMYIYIGLSVLVATCMLVMLIVIIFYPLIRNTEFMKNMRFKLSQAMYRINIMPSFPPYIIPRWR